MFYLNLAFLPNLSGWELILIFAVILLFFGSKRLPELSESLGKSLKRFKKATSEVEEEVRSAFDSKSSREGNSSTEESPESNTCSIEKNPEDSAKS